MAVEDTMVFDTIMTDMEQSIEMIQVLGWCDVMTDLKCCIIYWLVEHWKNVGCNDWIVEMFLVSEICDCSGIWKFGVMSSAWDNVTKIMSSFVKWLLEFKCF